MDAKVIEALNGIKEHCTTCKECIECERKDKKMYNFCEASIRDVPANWDLSDLEKDGDNVE